MRSNAPPDHAALAGKSTMTAGVQVERFQSRDLDDTRAYFARRFGDRSRVPRAVGDFYYGHVVADSGRTAVGTVRTALPQTLRSEVQQPTLFLPLRSGDDYRIGRRTLRSGPLTAVLLAPGHTYTCHSPANDWVGLVVSGDLMSQAIAAMRRGRSRPWHFKSIEIPLTPGRKVELLNLRKRMHALAVASRAAATPDAITSTERDAAAWLADIVVGRSGQTSIAACTVRRIERLERWIDANLHEDITLDRLCAVSGACGRALQKSVMALRGMSPMEWVYARRLAACRSRLLQGPSNLAVSRVALDCGIAHQGRFSAAYREAYGELPSATLAAVRSQPALR
jgi:AraC-like DNA-binding protein